MSKLLVTSLSVVVLALGVTAAFAHQAGSGMMQDGPQGQPSARVGQAGGGMPGATAGGYGRMGQGWMGQGQMGQSSMGGQGWGPNMMSAGMMGQSMMGPDMMLVMMDTNGDGALSLDEFQAVHSRMFKYLDANHDGKITADELNALHADHDGDQTGK